MSLPQSGCAFWGDMPWEHVNSRSSLLHLPTILTAVNRQLWMAAVSETRGGQYGPCAG
jgi:hypothetical protein